MFAIRDIRALEILDSRGEPTVQVTVRLQGGGEGVAAVPSGASTGTFEAHELRDRDQKRYGGKGVLAAVNNVNTVIAQSLVGFDAADQAGIDALLAKLDGTEDKHKLGANAILGVSLACCRAAASAQSLPLYRYVRTLAGMKESFYRLPIPLINVVNGGKHASSNLDLQEFWVIPESSISFRERLRHGSEVFHALGALLQKQGMDTDLGNEGGYAPNFASHRHVFELLLEGIKAAGLEPGSQVHLGIDAGSSVFFDADTGLYDLSLEHQELLSGEMQEYLLELAERYPIVAIEDGLAEEDWDGWQKLTAKARELKPKLRLIGDDLFVTNVERLAKGVSLGAANSILVKLNQIGTLSETLECIAFARQHEYDVVISHRSGETTDTFIADLAVAVNAPYIKTGSTARGERMAKYNRLLEIEEELYGKNP